MPLVYTEVMLLGAAFYTPLGDLNYYNYLRETSLCLVAEIERLMNT